MAKITSEQLRKAGACEHGVLRFEKLFPCGATITLRSCKLAVAEGLNVNWFVSHCLTKAQIKAYDKARAPAWEAYKKARAPAWEAYYDKATAPAWEAYDKARAPAWEAYDKATAPAWEAYDKATAPAWEAYKKAVAPALYYTLKMEGK